MIELTVFQKSDGPLTKRISLGSDGTIKSDGSQCIMPRGWARRVIFSDIHQCADRMNRFGPDEALATGSLRPDLPDEVEVVTKGKLNGANHPGIIARSQEYIVYRPGEAGLVLVDFDNKGVPEDVAKRLEKWGGVWSALVNVVPELAGIARVERASTSSGLYDSRTGEKFPSSGGRHVYLHIKDGSDAERFLKTLHERCWLAGLGWMMVGAGGQLLERSIVDRVCGTPERLAFEGAPVLISPLAQDTTARRAVAFSGDALDTVSAGPPLGTVDQARLRELRAKEAHRLAGDCAKAREDFIRRQLRRLAERTGMDPHRARRVIERQCSGVLLPYVDLPFDDPELDGKTVADVLADPGRFEGETLADPVEGIEYGRCKARIMRRADGSVWINSFAHGHAVYELKADFFAVKAGLEKAAKDEVADMLVRLVLAADLDEDEIEELRNIACDKTGITKHAMGRKIKNALREADALRAQQERNRRIAERRDPRPLLPVPPGDAEYGPQMKALNTVIGGDKSAEPPTRNPNKVVALAREFRVPSLHALSSAETNIDDDPPKPTARSEATDLEAVQ
jgi:hypothetical protein